MSDLYILDGKNPIKVNDISEWKINDGQRRVNKTTIRNSEISTVFLGIDHGFGGQVLLFETMVFGGKEDGHCERYSTWEDAEKGHHEVCEMIINL